MHLEAQLNPATARLDAQVTAIDEHDEELPETLVALGGGAWDADARAELEDVAETIDPRLGAEEAGVDTLGGLAGLLAGHIPRVGEMLAHGSGWKLEVTEADARRITRLRLHPPPPSPMPLSPRPPEPKAS